MVWFFCIWSGKAGIEVHPDETTDLIIAHTIFPHIPPPPLHTHRHLSFRQPQYPGREVTAKALAVCLHAQLEDI